MNTPDTLYAILIGLLFGIESVRAFRARRRFVPEQPLPKEGPYRTSGGSPGNAAIDILLEDMNRADEPPSKPVATVPSKTSSPEVETIVSLLALEHRVDALIAEVPRLTDRIHAQEALLARRTVATKSIGFALMAALVGAFTVGIMHFLIDTFR